MLYLKGACVEVQNGPCEKKNEKNFRDWIGLLMKHQNEAKRCVYFLFFYLSMYLFFILIYFDFLGNKVPKIIRNIKLKY